MNKRVFQQPGRPGLRSPGHGRGIGAENARYFEGLEAEGIRLSPAQKRWWARKAETLGGDMKREGVVTLSSAGATSCPSADVRPRYRPHCATPRTLRRGRGGECERRRGDEER